MSIFVDITTETRHYTGVTEDLHARLAKHNAGEVPHTSKFKPWRIQTVDPRIYSLRNNQTTRLVHSVIIKCPVYIKER